MCNKLIAGLLVPAALTLAISSTLHAQTLPQPGDVLRQNAAPAMLPQAPGQVLTLPEPAEQDGEAQTPVPVSHIVLQGNTLVSSAELEAMARPFEGRTVTLGDLQRLAHGITILYQRRGYPLSYAFVPAQRIQDGAVQISVVEARYDSIDVQGQSRLSDAQAKRTIGVASGEVIEQEPLNRGLLLLQRTPGVRVAGTLVPGAQADTSSLQVTLTDEPVVRTRAHLDNYGSEFTGRTRSSLDLSLDNPFGHGSQFAVNGMATSAGLMHSGGFNFTSPDLGQGVRAGVYGSRTLYRLGDTFAPLEVRGRANQVGVDVDVPLVLQPGRLLSARLDLTRSGYAQASAVTGDDTRSHIRMARFGLNGAWADAHGVTSGGLSLSRGDLGLDSADAIAADAAGPNARGTFWVGQFQLQRDQPLPGKWNLNLNFSAQLASRAVDGSEQFYLGGPYGVMSAPGNAGGGAAGALFGARLGHPLFDAGNHHLSGSVLVQGGKVWQRPNISGSQHLAGAGLGMDYRWGDSLHASLAYVRVIGATSLLKENDRDGQLWGRVNVDF
jgi:hemolysin activation/secretion protein